MGHTLIGTNGGRVDISCPTWAEILDAAFHGGWKPAGTLAPDSWPFERRKAWEGGYGTE